MSVIHSSWVLLGRRSSLMAGTARCSTVRSMAYSTAASASTASPVHSRRPALRTPPVACWPGLFMRVLLRPVAAGEILCGGAPVVTVSACACQPAEPTRPGRGVSMPDDGVPQVRCLWPFDHVEDFQLDVAAADVLEQAGAGAQQDRDQVDADLVDEAGPQQLLTDAGAEDVDILAAGGGCCAG